MFGADCTPVPPGPRDIENLLTGIPLVGLGFFGRDPNARVEMAGCPPVTGRAAAKPPNNSYAAVMAAGTVGYFSVTVQRALA
jgi:hypothetical protein